jgi:hypothetical protein
MSSRPSKRRPKRDNRKGNKRPVPVTEEDVFGQLPPDNGLDWNECRACIEAQDAAYSATREEYGRAGR